MTVDKLDKFKEKVSDANTICASVYGSGTVEYTRANKEVVAQMIELSDMTDINKEMLLELKEISKSMSDLIEIIKAKEVASIKTSSGASKAKVK